MSETNSDVAKPSLHGAIDSLSLGTLRGWLRDADRPNDPLAFVVLVDDVVLGRGTAAIYRGDLLKAGIGSANHGFEVALDASASTFAGKRLELRALDGRTAKVNDFVLPAPEAKGPKVEFVGAAGTGLQLRVRFPGGAPSEARLQVFESDGTKVVVPVQGGDSWSLLSVALAPRVFDGRIHYFRIGVEGAPYPALECGAFLRAILTPWEHLSRGDNTLALSHVLPQTRHRHTALSRLGSLGLPPGEVVERLEAARELEKDPAVRRDFRRLVFRSGPKPRVTVVIPVYNQFPYTYHCLASLIACAGVVPFEILVADDCSVDETTELEKWVEGVKLRRNPSNLGFLRSVNAAVSEVTTPYVVLLNNDTEVTPGWLEELLAPFSDERVGMTGSKLLFPDGTLQEAGGIVWKSGRPWNYGRGANPHHPRYAYTRSVDYVSGAALCIPKELWDSVGGFSDELAPAYYEDTDLAFKVRACGKDVVFAALSEVYHFEGRSNGTDVTSGVKKNQEINGPKFRKKWREAFHRNGTEGQEPDLEKDRGVDFRVLAIDYATPDPDADAGSYAAVQEMRLLRSLGFKVTFVPENLAHMGALTYALQRQGVEVITSPHYTSIAGLLDERGREFDLVYITRYDVAERWLPKVRSSTRAKVLLNNADLHFLRVLRGYLVAGAKDLQVPIDTRDRELKVMREVDAILSYNATEHAVIASHNLRADNLFLTPWVLGPRPYQEQLDARRGLAFLGGFRHYPNLEAVQFFVKDLWPKVVSRHPGTEFHVYGSYAPPRALRTGEFFGSDTGLRRFLVYRFRRPSRLRSAVGLGCRDQGKGPGSFRPRTSVRAQSHRRGGHGCRSRGSLLRRRDTGGVGALHRDAARRRRPLASNVGRVADARSERLLVREGARNASSTARISRILL